MTSTMPVEAEYIQGSDLPDLEVAWFDSQKQPIDMSSGYTFVAKVGILEEETLFTKNTGILGSPNGCIIAWATTGELNTLPPGRYTLEITATRALDNRQRKNHLSLKVKEQLP